MARAVRLVADCDVEHSVLAEVVTAGRIAARSPASAPKISRTPVSLEPPRRPPAAAFTVKLGIRNVNHLVRAN